MTLHEQTPAFWQLVATGVAQAVGSIPSWLRLSHTIDQPVQVPQDYFGVNVATSADPACDDYIVTALRDLGIQNTRLSYSADAVGGDAERLLERLLSEGFEVLLSLLPAREDAQSMETDTAAQSRWVEFVGQMVQLYGTRIGAFEIGNTPNRGRWSGYSSRSYLCTWQLAANLIQASDTPIAGPNVSDFEPIYNVGLLSGMGKLQATPAIHTNNLFVERVVQPEIYDHRVANRLFANWLKLNLVKKARVLAQISQENSIAKTYCTYTCWTRKRLSRSNALPEQKNADYLVRYLVLAAASGALQRVYWGPLICQRDGLVDCGNADYPKVDNVSYYRSVRGKVSEFATTAAYDALRNCVSLLRGARCLRSFNDVDGIHHFVFCTADDQHFHIVWCGDRRSVPLSALYEPSALENVRCYSPEATLLANGGLSISERPMILRWDEPQSAPRDSQLASLSGRPLNRASHLPSTQQSTHELQGGGWRGVYTIRKSIAVQGPAADEIPGLLGSLPVTKKLRDKRNKLWNIEAPWWSDGEQTVKLNRARGLKRLSYRFLPSKGLRHWNNATEILRQGINTPHPLGYFEQQHSNAADSYYICQYIEGAFSCRDVFTAFQQGDTEYRGLAKEYWVQQIAGFVAQVHERGITHRDLSSGNLMMTLDGDTPKFYLIDIGRAVTDKRRAHTNRMRFKDLNRICYKLDWPAREQFIEFYDSCTAQVLPGWWRLSLASYDWKQRTKKAIKGGSAKPKKLTAPTSSRR